MKNFLKGNISISRPSGTDENGERVRYISIELGDELSGTRFCSVRLSYEDFAQAITGLYSPCEFELHPDHVGKKYVHDTAKVMVDKYIIKNKTTKDLLMLDYLAAGWSYDEKDFENGHKYTPVKGSDRKYIVSVRLYKWE